MAVRTPKEVIADMTATRKRLRALSAELRRAKKAALEARDRAIVNDVLAAEQPRLDICQKHGVTYAALASVMHRYRLAQQQACLHEVAERHAPQQVPAP